MKQLQINITINLEDTLEQSLVSDKDFIEEINKYVAQDLEFYSQYGETNWKTKIIENGTQEI